MFSYAGSNDIGYTGIDGLDLVKCREISHYNHKNRAKAFRILLTVRKVSEIGQDDHTILVNDNNLDMCIESQTLLLHHSYSRKPVFSSSPICVFNHEVVPVVAM
ncbi:MULTISPECIES: hypothetical protein [unclassified Bacillus (in: firmicutes)]|uniref:hypothetical protein n=1 Tax=unclassified Bacillus (in: firmicutes) TaxID=185979 RepID=UPI001113A8A2|nr:MULTISPECIES: hypothetical protein [unclassified Bacillus (in: firmicutes)]